MVKLKGPMSSAEASGSLGQAATFSSWKGRAYARAKVVPTNPQSEAQTSVRAMLGFLSQQWAALSAANKATWAELAALTNIAPYSAYLAHNLGRWRQFHAPGQIFPVAEDGLSPINYGWYVTGGKAHVDISTTWTDVRDGWGVMFFHLPAALAVADRTNLFTIVPMIAGIPQTAKYHTTVLGLHYFRIQTFTTHGKVIGQSITKSATVT